MLPEIKIDEDFFSADSVQKNKGWLICHHFEGLNDIVNYYRNFHPLIIFSGTILCETCYQNMVEGKYPRVGDSNFEVTDARFKKIFGDALIEANERMQGEILLGG